MTTDDSALRRFLLSNGCEPGNADRALAALSPFAAIGASGRYPLGRASTADVGGIAVALWRAGRFHARGCVFLPSCAAHRRPDPGREAKDAFLLPLLRARFDHERAPAFAGRAYADALGAVIAPALAALEREIRDAGAIADADPAAIVRYVLETRTAFVAEGRREADDLAPLAALLPTFIPLFEDDRRDGIWHVLSGC